MIEQWEYKVVPKSYKPDELNKLGQEGWEMCGIEYFEMRDSEIFYFKRRCDICPHCKFLTDTFGNHAESTDREYWLMTEVFVYLHGGDVCEYTNDMVVSDDN